SADSQQVPTLSEYRDDEPARGQGRVGDRRGRRHRAWHLGDVRGTRGPRRDRRRRRAPRAGDSCVHRGARRPRGGPRRRRPQSAVYAAFKGGVTQFTKSLALELGAYGIRVNAIAPDLTQSVQVPYDRWVPEGQQHLIPTWVPLGRFGMPDDIAGVALFLASELSAFVTGTPVHADGGSYAAGGWFRTERGGWTNRPLS